MDSSSKSVFQKIKKFVVASRLLDYFICLVLGFSGWIFGRKVPPFCRSFLWNDASISNAHTKNTFPSWSLAPIAILPCLVYIIVEVARTRCARSDSSSRREVYPRRNDDCVGTNNNPRSEAGAQACALRNEYSPNTTGVEGGAGEEPDACSRTVVLLEPLNHWILAQTFSVTLCMFIIDITKVFTGRLRPDFLDRLRKAGYNESSTDVNWCKVAREGRLSFPSGHSGISFASFVPLILFFMGHLRVFHTGSVWRCVLALLFLILPIAVAVSRTRDNRHFVSDILGGSLIGSACGLLSVWLLFCFVGQTGMFLPRRMCLRKDRINVAQ